MNWHSWGEFFAMGGYALYVWGSVLMTFVLLGAELMSVRARRNTLLKQYSRWIRNNRREENEDKA
ncbi:heme exporter protein CcmD [Noviherbaspirillum sp.]|uniref:heme exporter protein CcmD n=1 Tax=Noviherbaspirillum sp. TaxID=1926288 RepID=UPI002B4680EF|nr:heme exporter protein CcmD [Noviherbaspirillum sp.]HJV83438.1 heme exporter protein CcmD [Noviherbaspirillum sp.]